VAFSANGTNAAKNAVAAFGAPGSYAITVTITDRGGLTATTAVTVVVIAPVVIAINERVSVTDATGSPIGVAEAIHIVDRAVVSVSGSTVPSPLSIAVNEHVSISDSLPPTSELAERVLIVDRATVSVHAIDRRPPVLELPGPVVAEATGPLGAIVSFTATAIDAVDGPRPVICAPASGSLFPLGHTTVLCTSTDRAGNEAHGRVNVRVRDTTPPVLATAPDVTVTTPLRRVPVTFTLPAATDAVDPAPIVTATPPSGSLFPVGSTTVRVRAHDESGNVRTDTFTVTVIQRPPR
jgi:hypothetical protein